MIQTQFCEYPRHEELRMILIYQMQFLGDIFPNEDMKEVKFEVTDS